MAPFTSIYITYIFGWAATILAILLSPHQGDLFTPSRPSDTSSSSWLLTTIMTFYLVSLWLAAASVASRVTGTWFPRSGFCRHFLHNILAFVLLVFFTWGWFTAAVEVFLMRASAFLSVAFDKVPAWQGLSADGVYNAYHATCYELNRHLSATCSARFYLHFGKALPRNLLWAGHVREHYDVDVLDLFQQYPNLAMLWIASCELLFAIGRPFAFP
ncbi:hypothetical protein RB595_000028 [Gaeumannomyces hyphopodioides]